MFQEFAYDIEYVGNKVQLTIDESLLPDVLQYLESLTKKKKNTAKEVGMFKRRVVPFFMNQFLHWAVKCKQKQVVKYLNQLRKQKDSIQKKFELGDLKDLFSKSENVSNDDDWVKVQTQTYWKQFLQGAAEESVLTNPKIKSNETKQQYIKAIPALISELDKLYPYDKLLSKFSETFCKTQPQQKVSESDDLGESNMQQDEDPIFQWSL